MQKAHTVISTNLNGVTDSILEFNSGESGENYRFFVLQATE